MNRRLAVPLSLLTVVALASPGLLACGTGTQAPQATDYSVVAHWLALPIEPVPTYPVDVFYLYPTAWTSTDTNPQICAIDEPSMLTQAPQVFGRQATAFATVGNIYAPFYRQDNLSSVDRWNVIAGIPTLDATAAFDHYIQNFNGGRPFIIGSPIWAEFLAENPHLRFATGADDVGVIVSWNTEGPGVVPGTNPVLYGKRGLVINPINWTRTTEQVPASQGLGSFMPSQVGTSVVWGPVGPQVCDAQIDAVNGVLICTTAPQDLMDLVGNFSSGIYHPFDIPFYYANLGQNAAVRAQRFLSQRSQP